MLKFKFKTLLRRQKARLDESSISASSRTCTVTEGATSKSITSSVLTSTEQVDIVTLAPPKDKSNLGLRLVGGISRQDAVVDIVLVHGLTGNSHGTWFDSTSGVHWPSTVLPQDIPDARIFCFGYDADVTSFWGHASRNRLTEHAKALMGDIVREREETDTESRDIIFIAHSLGGLLVEKALSLSRSRSGAHLKQLERYTIGIIFLGTPHHGSDLASWGAVCAKIAKKFNDTNLEIVNVLKPESEVLRDTQDDFWQLLESRKNEGRKIHITCFYEELAMSVVGQIVPISSATLLGYDSYGIHADHAAMARFSTRVDMGYKRIVGEIKRWVKEIRTASATRTSTFETPVSAETIEECLRSLHYQDMFFRQGTVPDACPLTFEWIWYNDDLGFRKWLRSGCGIFWISGKPGSGKSTLLKHISNDPVKIAKEVNATSNGSITSISRPVVARHFFQHGMGRVASSIEGLLRSLLWQVLREDASLSQPVVSVFLDLKRTTGNVSWSKRDLELTFRSILDKHRHRMFYIFVDALDEYSGDDAEIAVFLDTLAKDSPPNVRFCVTSRPYPDFAFQFFDVPTFRIHDYTAEDIRTFLKLKFNEVMAKQTHLDFFDLMIDTREKANGIFLWVKLVCDDLQRGWRQFDDASQLRQRLKKMPKDLDSMYRRILEDMQRDERDEACRMLAIAASAIRPLSLIEFYQALVYSTATCYGNRGSVKRIILRSDTLLEPLKIYLHNGLDFDDNVAGDSPQYAKLKPTLEGRIDAVCRGLLHVQGGRVRLLHETVETFFRGAVDWLVQNSFKLPSLDGDDLLARASLNYQIAMFEGNPTTWSIQPLRQSNLRKDTIMYSVYISGVDYRQYHEEHSWHQRRKVPLKYSFLFYAVDHWLDHACKAENATHRSQLALMNSFSGHSFTVWRTLFGIHNPARRQMLPFKLLDIIIESGLNLTATEILDSSAHRAHNGLFSELDDQESRNRLLFSVAKGGSPSVAKSVFALGLNFNCRSGNRPAPEGSRGPIGIPNERALHRAIYFNHSAIVDLFVRDGADIDLEIDSRFLEEWANLIEPMGADPPNSLRRESVFDGQNGFCSHGSLQRTNARRTSFVRVTREGKIWMSRPLEFAVLCDRKAAFFTLLSFYPQNTQHESLLLALTAAAFKGRIDYVRALLDHGVNPNLPSRRRQGCFILGTHTCHAILPAVYWGYFDIVKLLISRGTDVNVQASCEASGSTSLGRASHNRRPRSALSVAHDRCRLYPSNQSYLDMIDLLEKNGASRIGDTMDVEVIAENLNE